MIAIFWVRQFLRLLAVGAALLAATVAVAAPTADRSLVVRRFALITGASQGGPGRVPLRYAGTDARAMQHVLTELGGLPESGTILLLDVDRAALRAGFDRLKKMVASAAAPGARTEIVFYYSGHSDDAGLLLGSERVSYQEVRSWVEETGADVRIAVLDSCASGALTRSKGGVHRPPFLVDTSSAARGHAYLTASAENESAQESDRLGAAYFTHYLVSGLRGAADVSHDGRVTLSEAYQYAFTETLARTETSRGGPQHASYDFQLAGKGDLVMTDLHATTASLQFPPEMSGRLYVRDAAGQLVAEVHKLPSQPIELGLPPGLYRVTLDDQRRLYETSVELAAGHPTTLSPQKLVALVPAQTVSRGDAPPVLTAEAPPPPPSRPLLLSVYPGFDTSGGVLGRDRFVLGFVARSAALDGASLTLVHLVDGPVRGFQLGDLAVASGTDMRGFQLAGLAAGSGADLHGFQVAGLAAGARGGATGGQLAGLVSWAGGPLLGGQVAGIVTSAAGGQGGQIAGVANVSDGDFRGAQISGVANLARRFRGPQISGVFNGAETLNGVQIAVVNVGGDVNGAQIGVVNVARHARGTQIGVVNVDDEMTGAPIGLVNIVRNGIHEAELSVSDVGAPVASAVLGTRRLYTRLGFGVMAASNDIPGVRNDPTATGDKRHYLVQWGFGGRLTLDERWFVDLEAVGTQYYKASNFDQENAVTGGLRALAGLRLAPQMSLVFGPTYNVSVGWSGTDLVTGRDFASATFHDGATTVRMFPGLVLGLRV
jgi:hypothetical protein